ncbi:MAG: Nif3-like dinuclear metal center hexameric protein [Deltaproteobacteria bacterium]|jgi:dinuclear metal center YbgI/SA1388 family protein|nr:Nif3-like dinuclear metal center hexameric protein [Deltaproteobacteria bacterium]
MKVKDFLDIIECLTPSGLALDWDNSGLQAGDPMAKVNKAALALDPTLETIKQAIDSECQLLVTHHPLIFKATKCLNFQDPVTAPVCLALSKGLSVISAHYNWDNAGVADELADLLELKERRILCPEPQKLLKVVIFVPSSHQEIVRQAVFQTGAGVVGAYADCYFKSSGLGGFHVPPNAAPFCGEPGSSCETPEERLEMILAPGLRNAVDRAVRSSHPYEEPAFEFHDVTVTGKGVGLIGVWEKQEPRKKLYEILGDQGLWAGPEPGPVTKLALLPGSGGGAVLTAKAAGAELLVTGDVNHHQAILANSVSLPVYSAGHFETERPGVRRLAREIAAAIERRGGKISLSVLEESPPLRRLPG